MKMMMNVNRLKEIIKTGKANSVREAIKAACNIEKPHGTLDLDPSGERIVPWLKDGTPSSRQELANRRFRTALRLYFGYKCGEEYSVVREPGSWRDQLREIVRE